MRKVLNNQLPLASRRRHTKFFFFIGSQNRFHLLIYTPWIGWCGGSATISLTCHRCNKNKATYNAIRWNMIKRIILIYSVDWIYINLFIKKPKTFSSLEYWGNQNMISIYYTDKPILTCKNFVILGVRFGCQLAILGWMELGVCSAFFYNFFLIYWSMILFVLRIQIGIDFYTIIDKALYWYK